MGQKTGVAPSKQLCDTRKPAAALKRDRMTEYVQGQNIITHYITVKAAEFLLLYRAYC